MDNILLVDDDRRLRLLITEFLEQHGMKITSAESAEQARALLAKNHYDAMILDVMMPGEDGFSFTKWMRDSSKASLPIILLTAKGETEDRIKGLEQGASDYLTKPFEPKELQLRIQNMLSKQTEADAEKSIVGFGDYTWDSQKNALYHFGDFINLTTTETSLLAILASQPDKPVSREVLAKALHGISERSVDVQITRLRKRIEEDVKNPEYIQTVRGEGYRLMLH